MTDDLWLLTEKCWTHKPSKQPSIASVTLDLSEITGGSHCSLLVGGDPVTASEVAE